MVHVDLIVRNANILTMDPRRPRARELAVLAGQVVAVDDVTGVSASREPLLRRASATRITTWLGTGWRSVSSI